MSAIFTPPWTMGNGVGMGTSTSLDLSVHGHRGWKLRELLRGQFGLPDYTQTYAASLLSLRLDLRDITPVAEQVITEMRES